MDKYEYRIKAEQIQKLVKKKDYQTAAKIADSIDWRRVKNVSMLCTVSEVYEKTDRIEDSYEVLNMAYDRAPIGRMIVYKMAELATRMEDFDEAAELYKEFVKIAPNDLSRYILKYQIYKAKGAPLEEQIGILEEFKGHEYHERWSYELALLYHKAGMAEKCVEECDDLILWFSEGEYVIKAMELKMQHQPLTKSQQHKYDSQMAGVMYDDDEDEDENENEAQEEEKEIAVQPVNVNKFNTIDLQQELATGLKDFIDVDPEPAEEVAEEEPAVSAAADTEPAETEVREAEAEEAEQPEEPKKRLQPVREEEATAKAPVKKAAPVNLMRRKEAVLQREAAKKKTEPAPVKKEIPEIPMDLQNTADILDLLVSAAPKLPDDILRLMAELEEEEAGPAGKPAHAEEKAVVQTEEEQEAAAPVREVSLEDVETEDDLPEEVQETVMEEIPEEAPAHEDYEEADGEPEEAETVYEEDYEDSEGYAEDYDEDYEESEGFDAQEDYEDYIEEEEAYLDEDEPELEEEEDEAEPEEDEELPEIAEPDELEAPEKGKKKADVASAMIQDLENALAEELAAVGDGKLTEEESKLFAYFTSVRGMNRQLARLLAEDKDRPSQEGTSAFGNLVIVGERGTGKTTLAVDIVKALQKQRAIKGSKVAKVTADSLNTKDIQGVIKKLNGGALIIERAGELSDQAVKKLSKAMLGQTGELLVILEDEMPVIRKMFARHVDFARKFSNTIEIPVFTNQELVAFGKSYATEQECVFDEMGMLALYNCIGNRQSSDHLVNITEVKEMIDNAIEHAERGGIKGFFGNIGKKRRDEFGNTILMEKDFDE